MSRVTVFFSAVAALTLVACTRPPSSPDPLFCQWQSEEVKAEIVFGFAADNRRWAVLHGLVSGGERFVATAEGDFPAPDRCHQLFFSRHILHCAGNAGVLWRRDGSSWHKVDVPSTFSAPVLIRGDQLVTLTCHRDLGLDKGGGRYERIVEVVAHDGGDRWFGRGNVPFASCPVQHSGPLNINPSPFFALGDGVAFGWGVDGTMSIRLSPPKVVVESPLPALDNPELGPLVVLRGRNEAEWLGVPRRSGKTIDNPLVLRAYGPRLTRVLDGQPRGLLRSVSCKNGSVDKVRRTQLAYGRRGDLEIIAISGRPAGQSCVNHTTQNVVQMVNSPHESRDLLLPGHPTFKGMAVDEDGAVQLLVVFDEEPPRRFWQSCTLAPTGSS